VKIPGNVDNRRLRRSGGITIVNQESGQPENPVANSGSCVLKKGANGDVALTTKLKENVAPDLGPAPRLVKSFSSARYQKREARR
jgi:hypothetical protein